MNSYSLLAGSGKGREMNDWPSSASGGNPRCWLDSLHRAFHWSSHNPPESQPCEHLPETPERLDLRELAYALGMMHVMRRETNNQFQEMPMLHRLRDRDLCGKYSLSEKSHWMAVRGRWPCPPRVLVLVSQYPRCRRRELLTVLRGMAGTNSIQIMPHEEPCQTGEEARQKGP